MSNFTKAAEGCFAGEKWKRESWGESCMQSACGTLFVGSSEPRKFNPIKSDILATDWVKIAETPDILNDTCESFTAAVDGGKIEGFALMTLSNGEGWRCDYNIPNNVLSRMIIA